MSKDIIRIKFLSLNDAADEPVPNILLYLKKLTQVSTSDASRVQLDEKSFESSVVFSFNEPYDLTLDDEFFQILFIQSKDEAKVFDDIIFYRHYLLDLLNYSVKDGDIQRELFCYASLDKKCILKYSLQFAHNFVKEKKIHRKVDHQSIRGHLMIKYQFNQPVCCAICNKFIMGFRLQGYRCERCSLVTHQKCHKRIPFCCQKSPHPVPSYYTGNRRLDYHPAHVFKRYQPSFLPSITPCKNCGSHVSGNGLKCELCGFVIHERCEMSIPSMCGISYKAWANALEKNLIQIDNADTASDMTDKRISLHSNTSSLDSAGLNTTEEDSSHCSSSSSIDVRWLEPLLQGELTNLPKFADFECIGRLGSGQYSNVYCARYNPSKKYAAMKVINGSIESARQQFEVERQILFRYSQENPYMIKAYCSFHQGCTLFLLMEFVGDDTLKEKIQKTRMNESEIRYYLAEIISVIQYLHSNKIIHRDLKLEHVLVCSDGHIRLVDFGLGRILNSHDEVCHTICGTDTYMSPEIRRLEKDRSADGYSYAVDYWAIGIILVQLLCGEQLDFYDEDNDLLSFAENLLSYRYISAEARSLVRGLLEVDPKKRLGSANSPYGSIRDHPFFKMGKEMDWDEVDDGVLKPIHGSQTLTETISDLSIESSLPISSFDRGNLFNREWINAGQSVCAPHEEELYKSFDYINRSNWSKFIQKNE